MIDHVNEMKLGVAAIGAALTSIWGWFGWLVVFWVGCMALDYITGTMAACKNHGWESQVATDGLWKKAGSIIAVMVSGGTDYMVGMVINNIPTITIPFQYTVFVCPLVLVWYSVTELGSIVENAGSMGAKVPNFLQKVIAVFQDGIDAAGDKVADGADIHSGKKEQ